MPAQLAADHPVLYRFLLNKWYFDELYDAIFVRPGHAARPLPVAHGRRPIIDGLGPDGVSARVLDVTRGVVRRADRLPLPLRLRDAHRRRGPRHLLSVPGGTLMLGFGILSGLLILPLVGAAFILTLRGDSEAANSQRALGGARHHGR